VFVSCWCYKSGLLKVICQFSDDGIGCRTRVKFVLSHWSVLICLLLVKLSWSVRGPFVGFIHIVRTKPFLKVPVVVSDISKRHFSKLVRTSFPDSVVENSLYSSFLWNHFSLVLNHTTVLI